MSKTLFAGARLADGRLADVRVADGRIAAVTAPGGEAEPGGWGTPESASGVLGRE